MLDENYIVEKSKALVWADLTNYGLPELRFLDIYLSRINARNPESATVTFTKAEYCKLVGLDTRTDTARIRKSLSKLMHNEVAFPYEDGYELNVLFTRARCYTRNEDGKVIITIECNPNLSKLFFNISEDGYIRYKLKNMIGMTSKYSVLLYNILKDAEYRGYLEIRLTDLKKHLNVNEGIYDKYKVLNDKIIKPSVANINEKADIIVAYETIRENRKVASIRFNIKKKTSALELASENKTADRWEDVSTEEISSNDVIDYAFYSEAVDNSMTKAQLKHLVTIALQSTQPFTNIHETELAVYDMLRELYLDVSTREGVKDIHNYMATVLKAKR